jgi:2-C-methyl-D-erythritol 2,4-cyclodiphosphate synthase
VFRVGQGFDVHRFSGDPGRSLVLGGVTVSGAPGLAGHSDADVLSHAVADALLGASGLGDLGGIFPDTSDEWEGADSVQLLSRVVGLLTSSGFRPVNSDCTVVCERPRLSPHTDEMASNLAHVTGAPASVKAKRAEGLGALGRVEGIACLCVCLVEVSVHATSQGE